MLHAHDTIPGRKQSTSVATLFLYLTTEAEPTFETSWFVDQGCPTHGTCAQNGTWHSLLSQFIVPFVRPLFLHCAQHVYIHTYLTAYRPYMNYRCYQITLQWNTFTQIGAVRNFDLIFMVGALVWRWLVEYVTLDRRFCSLLLNGKQQQPQLWPLFLLIAFFEEAFIRNIMW